VSLAAGRLGRSLRYPVETGSNLTDRGVMFRSLHEGIQTTTSTRRLIFYIFAALRISNGTSALRGRPWAGMPPCPAWLGGPRWTFVAQLPEI
jgi:hypothetical protein